MSFAAQMELDRMRDDLTDDLPPVEDGWPRSMTIRFPFHPVGPWKRTPLWMFWKPRERQRHWRWTFDHRGCQCVYYWNYR